LNPRFNPRLVALHRIRHRVERDLSPYMDAALMPIDSDLLPARRKEKALTGATA
jgi:hypothetical protein